MSSTSKVPRFHQFPRYEKYWPNVYPGDVIISPGTYFWKLEDFFERDVETKCVITQYKPLLVISKISGLISQKDDLVDENLSTFRYEDDVNAATFIVYSISSGLLITYHLTDHRSAAF